MKFQCDRCKTRYSIGEEKIRGKVLKIRCKNCSSVITVREGAGAVTEKAAPGASEKAAAVQGQNGAHAKGAAAKGAAAPATPALDDAFQRAMSRLPTPEPARGETAKEDSEAFDSSEGDSTRLAPAPAMPGDPDGDIEWYVSVDGEQEGPFTLPEAQTRVSRKQPLDEMFAWQDGFDDWLPVEKIPELASALPKPAPSRKARPSAPPIPSDAGFPGPGHGKSAPAALAAAAAAAEALAASASASTASMDEGPLSLSALSKAEAPASEPSENFDFEIGEASRVVKLPMLVPPPGGLAGGGASGGPAAGRSGSLPGVGGNGLSARGTGGMPVVGQVLPADANAAAQIMVPKPRKGHGMLFFIGGGVLAAIAVVLVIVLAKGAGGGGSTAMGQEGVDGFDIYASEFGQVGQEHKPGQPGEPDKSNNPLSRLPGRKPRQNPGTNPANNGGTTVPGRDPNGIDLSDPNGAGLRDRDAEEVLQARQRNQGPLQQCWERALKLNPDLKARGVKFDVQLTITAAGRVNGVTVNGGGAEKELRDCVRQRISGWGFKQANNDMTTQVTLVFN